jgi:hypothetical protein
MQAWQSMNFATKFPSIGPGTFRSRVSHRHFGRILVLISGAVGLPEAYIGGPASMPFLHLVWRQSVALRGD